METELTTKEIQAQLLVLLKKFDCLCRENGIRYSLHGGTLLGAIREKGFIPWDDDADVSMGRREYEKLQSILLDKNKDSELKITYDINHVPKAVYKQKEREPVWLDIFVYDYITQNRFLQKLKIKILAVLSVFMKPKGQLLVRKAIYQFPKWMRVPYYIVYALGTCFPLRWRVSLGNGFAKYCFCGKKKLVHRSNDQYAGLGHVFPVGMLDSYQTVPFEGEELMVFTACRDVLIASYGENYMTPVKYDEVDSGIHEKIRNALSSGAQGGVIRRRDPALLFFSDWISGPAAFEWRAAL